MAGFDGTRPIFLQLAEMLEEGIISGAYPEEGQIPSITEFSATLKINPATALKGINLLVDEGLGYALCLDKIVTAHPQGNLCFRPLAPRLAVGLAVAWKKSQTFSPAAAAFLACLREEIATFREQPGPAAGDAFPQTT